VTVNTAKVKGRRSLHFNSFDEIVAEAERLAAGRTVQLGNWSLGQILKHLAAVMHASIDGMTYQPPWFVRWTMRVVGQLITRYVLAHGMWAGFQLPRPLAREVVAADGTTTEEGLAALRAAVRRLKTDPRRDGISPFGRLTPEQWDRIQLRHAELHLSFIVPA
jgi:hypothetical protein